MIEMHGKPFLEYLINLLKKNGIQEIVLLLGYLPEKIKEYFKDGSDFGINIKYSIGDVDFETGKRIKYAEGLLDDNFLLMYCDNLVPLNLDKLVASILDVGMIKYKNKLYEILYDSSPYIEATLAAETSFALINTIQMPPEIPALIIDFSATTESTDGEDLSIGFNRTFGSSGLETALSRNHYGPYPLGSTGAIQVDTFKEFPVFLKPQEKVEVFAENTHATNSITFGYVFHFIFLREAAIF